MVTSTEYLQAKVTALVEARSALVARFDAGAIQIPPLQTTLTSLQAGFITLPGYPTGSLDQPTFDASVDTLATNFASLPATADATLVNDYVRRTLVGGAGPTPAPYIVAAADQLFANVHDGVLARGAAFAIVGDADTQALITAAIAIQVFLVQVQKLTDSTLALQFQIDQCTSEIDSLSQAIAGL